MSTFLSLNKKLDAVACDYTLTDYKENPIEEKNCMNFPIGCGIMFRIQHLLEMGLYDEKFLYAEEEALRKNFYVPTILLEFLFHCIDIDNIKKPIKESQNG